MLIFNKEIEHPFMCWACVTPHGWLAWIPTYDIYQGEEYNSGGATWMFGFDGGYRRFSDLQVSRFAPGLAGDYLGFLPRGPESHESNPLFYSRDGRLTSHIREAWKIVDYSIKCFSIVINEGERDDREFLLGLSHNIEQNTSAVILCRRETQQTAVLAPVSNIVEAKIAFDDTSIFIIGKNQVAIVDNPLVDK